MPERPSQHRLLSVICWGLAVFLILFPKGGLKVGPIPLTWGYFFLGLTLLPVLIVRLLALPLRWPLRLLAALAMLAPMQVLMVYAFAAYGVADAPFAISHVVSLFVLPWTFLLVYPPFLPLVDGRWLSSIFRMCVLLAALWGIFLFVLHPITHHYIEIPYLTVNAADYGQIEATKHIDRGLFFKLISTYNNGNLYGVATLILLPLYDALEPNRWRRYILKLALLFTLSRTVWLGLLINETLPVVVLLWRQTATFPVLHLHRFGRRLIAILVMAVMVVFALILEQANLAFLFDPQAGGRVGEISNLGAFTWLPSVGLRGFFEVVYASVLQDLGYAGLFAFILLMGSPLLLLLIDRSALRSPLRRAALKGLVLYAALAFSDGAFDLIPVMAFYWFVYMIYLFDWPRFLPVFTLASSPAVCSTPDGFTLHSPRASQRVSASPTAT
jgi:hypothetical protein